jgi:Cu/Ag efflux protein CusF
LRIGLPRWKLRWLKPEWFEVILALRFALASVALALALGAGAAGEMAAKGIFDGHGVVKAIAPGTGALTLAHDDIKGFMPAMEMMYRVSAPEISKDLRPGDEVNFKIDAEKYTIIEVKLVAHAK